MSRLIFVPLLFGLAYTTASAGAQNCPNNVADLDTTFQAAVKTNDVATIDRLLPDSYILVSDLGDVASKADLVNEARQRKYAYVHQEDSRQTVRTWGDTAVLTALLWAEGTTAGRHFNVRVWFSDTYVCTGHRWRYVFGQVGTHVPVGSGKRTGIP